MPERSILNIPEPAGQRLRIICEQVQEPATSSSQNSANRTGPNSRKQSSNSREPLASETEAVLGLGTQVFWLLLLRFQAVIFMSPGCRVVFCFATADLRAQAQQETPSQKETLRLGDYVRRALPASKSPKPNSRRGLAGSTPKLVQSLCLERRL